MQGVPWRTMQSARAAVSAALRLPMRPSARTPRNRGVDPRWARPDHSVMEPLNPPPKTPQGADLDARVQAWIQLRDQMRNVEAQLEYVRLMLKMGVRPGSKR